MHATAVGSGGSCRPQQHTPRQTRTVLTPGRVAQMALLRRQRRSQRAIAAETGVSLATVSRALAQAGISRLRDLQAPVHHYEHPEAGDLLHLDIKKLGRIVKPGHRVTGDPRDSVPGARSSALTGSLRPQRSQPGEKRGKNGPSSR